MVLVWVMFIGRVRRAEWRPREVKLAINEVEGVSLMRADMD